MTILVTGGAGFIGSNFVLDWLASHDEPVVNLDALTYAGNLHNLAPLQGDRRHLFVKGDIADRPLVDRLLAEHQPRVLVHFAAESHVDRSILGPGGLHQDQHRRQLHAAGSCARTYWGGLAGRGQVLRFRFQHVSTDEVYGSLAPDAPAFTETHPFEPNSPYSASKAASDHLVRAWHHTYGHAGDSPPTAATTTGRFHFPEKLIPLMIANALAGKPLPIYGDGLQVRDWLYVRRPLQRHPRGHRARPRRARLYNVGGWNEKTNREIVAHRVHACSTRLKPDPAGPSLSA